MSESVTRNIAFAVGLTALMAAQASAAIVFSEDFQDDTVGELPTGTTGYTIRPNGTNGTTENITANRYVRVADGGAIGTAGSNKYLEFNDNQTGGSNSNTSFVFGAAPGVGGALALQFDLYEYTAVQASPGPLTVRLFGGSNDAAGSGPQLNFTDGAITAANNATFSASYTLGQTNTYTLSVDNNTKTYDLFQNGNLIGNDLAYVVSNLNTITGISFLTNQTSAQRVAIDNLLVSDTAVVPEPTSLVGVVLLGGLLRRRRR
ncbi:MAG TPA: PEP-CTERM sorting domain-containing protein [Tepidisphaeraceae bacterium]|nr:PEP-CTERM sorting domain-containing protein [Tepidisphaeraceae bacterium]